MEKNWKQFSHYPYIKCWSYIVHTYKLCCGLLVNYCVYLVNPQLCADPGGSKWSHQDRHSSRMGGDHTPKEQCRRGPVNSKSGARKAVTDMWGSCSVSTLLSCTSFPNAQCTPSSCAGLAALAGCSLVVRDIRYPTVTCPFFIQRAAASSLPKHLPVGAAL